MLSGTCHGPCWSRRFRYQGCWLTCRRGAGPMTKSVGSCRAWNFIRRRETGQWAENSDPAPFVDCTVVCPGLLAVSSPTDTEAALVIKHCVKEVASSMVYGLCDHTRRLHGGLATQFRLASPKGDIRVRLWEFEELDVPGLLYPLPVGQSNQLVNNLGPHGSRTRQSRATGVRRESQVTLTA